LSVLEQFFLPGIYGLLGACVFLLRRTFLEIEGHTLSSELTHRVRIWLGGLAGLAIGLVLPSGPQAQMGLAPAALPFIAGYSVDVLIMALDRLIAAFSDPDPKVPSALGFSAKNGKP
jgi:hypothetical protein